MNIGSSPFIKTLGNIAAIAVLSLVTTTVLANPKQIEIIGLIPDVSTKTQVDKVSEPFGDGSNNAYFIIGGFKLACFSEYIEGFLSRFACYTGKEMGSRDITGSSDERVSNLEVYSKLLEGFTNKFGPPSIIQEVPLSNNLGATFISNRVQWIDQNGNELSISSVMQEVGMGSLLFESGKRLKQLKTEKINADNQRKF